MTTTEPGNDNGDDVQEGEDNPMTDDELEQAHADAAGVDRPTEPDAATHDEGDEGGDG